MEDFFAYTFLYQLKRQVIYEDGEDSEDYEPEEKDPPKDGTDKKVEDEDKDDGASKREETSQSDSNEKRKYQIPTAYDVYASHRISISSKFYLLVAA